MGVFVVAVAIKKEQKTTNAGCDYEREKGRRAAESVTGGQKRGAREGGRWREAKRESEGVRERALALARAFGVGVGEGVRCWRWRGRGSLNDDVYADAASQPNTSSLSA
eukprot:4168375-Pleurochrysis_carterae.AAC.2